MIYICDVMDACQTTHKTLTIRAYIKKYTGKKEADISMIDMLIFRNW